MQSGFHYDFEEDHNHEQVADNNYTDDLYRKTEAISGQSQEIMIEHGIEVLIQININTINIFYYYI